MTILLHALPYYAHFQTIHHVIYVMYQYAVKTVLCKVNDQNYTY